MPCEFRLACTGRTLAPACCRMKAFARLAALRRGIGATEWDAALPSAA
jgi:hypothetical protein